MTNQVEIYEGDCRPGLLALPAGYLHTVVTSIPYYGLRAYGTAPQVWGGDLNCPHVWAGATPRGTSGGTASSKVQVKGVAGFQKVPDSTYATCGLCGAWRGELGSEPTPDLFVAHIVEVFRAVWHALRPDGTVWLNIGDSYSGGSMAGGNGVRSGQAGTHHAQRTGTQATSDRRTGLGDKQLLLMPARVALALQADGWTVRSEIIWAKPNPMPESVTDRPTKAHEQIYLLTKGPRYFYDAEAIRETEARPYAPGWGTGKAYKTPGLREQQTRQDRGGSGQAGLATGTPNGTRNARTVWTVASEPYPAAHFATFPTELPRRCILAGTSARGCCSACGAPWRRVVATDDTVRAASRGTHAYQSRGLEAGNRFASATPGYSTPRTTTGWEPTCRCAAEVVPCRVGDPFLGSGTTAAVAVSLGRAAWGAELQPAYVPLIRARVAAATPWYAAQPTQEADLLDLPLFAPRE